MRVCALHGKELPYSPYYATHRNSAFLTDDGRSCHTLPSQAEPNKGIFTVLERHGFVKVAKELGLQWDEVTLTERFDRACALLKAKREKEHELQWERFKFVSEEEQAESERMKGNRKKKVRQRYYCTRVSSEL